MPSADPVDAIIDRNLFREEIFDMIEPGTRRILDFGCNEGELLLRLRRDKGCSELYGVDVMERVRPSLEAHLDGGFITDLHHHDLPEELVGFFDVIVMHDVLEHLYDPWFVLEKLRNHLAVGGRLVAVVPNFQFWGLWGQVFNGEFTYGRPGGLMNEEHVRWFTPDSILELFRLTNLEPLDLRLLFPPGLDQAALARLLRSGPIRELSLPPREHGGEPQITISFSGDIRQDYMRYLANKILVVAGRTRAELTTPQRTEVGTLELRRAAARAGVSEQAAE